MEAEGGNRCRNGGAVLPSRNPDGKRAAFLITFIALAVIGEWLFPALLRLAHLAESKVPASATFNRLFSKL